MKVFDPERFGGRLQDELGRKGWNIKTFQESLETKVPGKRKGTAYGSVWSYVNGKAGAEPRGETVAGMAELFSTPDARVRADYLLYGDSPRTEEEADAQRKTDQAGAEAAAATEWRADLTVVQEAFGNGSQRLAKGLSSGTVLRCWYRLFFAGLVPSKPGPPSETETYPGLSRLLAGGAAWNPEDPPEKAGLYATGRALGWTLRAVFQHLSIQPGELNDEEFHDFIVLTCQAMIGLATARAGTVVPRR